MLTNIFPLLFKTIQRDSAISFPGLLGDFSINPPAYFTVFGIDIYFYGVLITLGFILGILFCERRSKQFGIKADDVIDLVLWLVPLSIVGARLYYVLFELEYFIANPAAIFSTRDGGLAIYGGVIAGVLTAFFVCRHKKIPITAMLDLLVMGLLIGQIIGRFGNFMNREAFGAETTAFLRMGLTSPSGETIYVHPTFLYEALWNLATLVFLVVWTGRGKRRYDGQGALIYFLCYGIGRTWIEGLRTDSLYIGSTDIRVSQVLSVALALISLIVLIIQARREHPKELLYVNRVKEAADAENDENAPAIEKTENIGGN